MVETRPKEELASLRRRYEASALRAADADNILAALTAILGASRPDRIGETIFDSFRGLVVFEAAFVLEVDAGQVAHLRFSTHPVRMGDPAPQPALARVAAGRPATLPDARRAQVLAPFLPPGDGPVSAMMTPFSGRTGDGLILFVHRGFGVYQPDQAMRLKRFGIVAAQGLFALEEIRLARDIDRAEREREVEHAANVAKSRLLSRISHELRTPLNGVLGSAYLLKARGVPEAFAATVQDIESCGKEMLRLISDLIEFAASPSAPAASSPADDDLTLGGVVQAVAGQYGLQAAAKGLTLETRLDPCACALRLRGMSTVRRVLSILVDNAVKYADRGPVTLECRPGDDGFWILQVADAGPGMTADMAAAVFEPFRRGDASHTAPVDGLGLGLPLAARLAARLGGRISVDTAPGQGARVSLLLPMDMPQALRA